MAKEHYRDMERLNDGFGDKMATFIQWVATFIGGYANGFIAEWKLTLVVISVSPLIVIATAVMSRVKQPPPLHLRCMISHCTADVLVYLLVLENNCTEGASCVLESRSSGRGNIL